MKRFQKWVLILGLILAGHARAADDGATGNYSGTVVDEKGQPVAEATVDCYHYPSPVGYGYPSLEPEFAGQTVTDGKGLFTVPGAPGPTLAVVKKAGLATAWKTWSPAIPDSSDPVVLSAPTTLAGTVVDENNQPVAGAEVWVTKAILGDENGLAAQENQLGGKEARENFSTRTTADGRFRIKNFPDDGHAALAVKMTGKAQRPIGRDLVGGVAFRSGDVDVELMVGPAGAVAGKVVVAETGQPLGGVKMDLRSNTGANFGTEFRNPIESGTDGTFHIADVAPGTFNVLSTMPSQPLPDWAVTPEDIQVTVVAGETASNVVAHVTKGVVVEVTVVTTNELKPLAGVTVVASGHSIAYTDAKGAARLRVPPGMNWFSTSKKEWSPQQRTLEIKAGQVNHVRLVMIPPPRITGTVRDPAGNPVAGAIVSFHPGYYPAAPEYVEVTTDQNGRYEMTMWEDSRGGAVLWNGPICPTNFILARSLERNLVAIHDFAAIPTKLDFTLQPGITLSGFVKDANGAPVTTATVDLGIEAGNSNLKFGPRPVKVDAQGSFVFPAMPQGRAYSFFDGVTAKGYGGTWGWVKAEDTKTNHYAFPPFVLKRADRKLAGQVLGPDGNPVAGASLQFTGQGQPWPSTKSDSKGHFAFDAVCEGAVQLMANWIGPIVNGEPSLIMNAANGSGIQAQAGETNLVIRLSNFYVGRRELKAVGTVFDPDGVPAPGVWLSVLSFTSRGGTHITSDAKGKYTVQWQTGPTPGSLPSDLLLVGRDRARNLAVAADLGDTSTNLDLHLQPGLTLSGKVQDGDGKPMTDVDLRFIIHHGRWELPMAWLPEIVVNAQGLFSISNLPPGQQYEVRATAEGYGRSHSTASADETRTNQFQLPPVVLAAANRQLAGVVRGLDGNPYPGARVSVAGAVQPIGLSSLTEANGYFVIANVCAGVADLRVSLPNRNGGFQTVAGIIQVHAGDVNIILKLALQNGATVVNQEGFGPGPDAASPGSAPLR